MSMSLSSLALQNFVKLNKTCSRKRKTQYMNVRNWALCYGNNVGQHTCEQNIGNTDINQRPIQLLFPSVVSSRCLKKIVIKTG